jgi:flavin reductase (DIM6/NTAB) family NADH-FMN oxidoreductase RutF
MKRVAPADLRLRPFHLLDQEWALLVAGSRRPNPMTVSWGGFGTLWNRPVATVYVRPTRHTASLMEDPPEFTLNFVPEPMREALDYCGSRSGRDYDKWAEAGISPEPSETLAVPRVAGAHLVLECRTIYTFDLDPQRFKDTAIEDHYPRRDYHRAYVGEVLAVFAADRFLAP